MFYNCSLLSSALPFYIVLKIYVTEKIWFDCTKLDVTMKVLIDQTPQPRSLKFPYVF